MPMSSGGYAASSSGCATRPKVRETGSTGYVGPTQHSLLIGRYVMATAEHREPCDSRGSCTVLGAPGGEIPPSDSTIASVLAHRSASAVGQLSDFRSRFSRRRAVQAALYRDQPKVEGTDTRNAMTVRS